MPRLLYPLTIIIGAAMLAACATPATELQWQPRADANLAGDLAVCEADARSVDMQSANAYSDSRYGAVAALAGQVNRSDMRGGGSDRVYQAVLDICMTRKGWKRAG